MRAGSRSGLIHSHLGYRTGLWLGELTEFYDVVESAGIPIGIASPRGGRVAIDPESLILSKISERIGITTTVDKRYEDRAFMRKLDDTPKPLIRT